MPDRSYEKINYALRPAKTIERKMLVEAFRKLSGLGISISSYRYIGFGSTYFSDFILIHRTLGINNMISIEKDEHNSERFYFNRPFGCIRIEFGESNNVLPTLAWDAKTILWLDYDSKLDTSILTDVKFACMNAPPSSVLLVTVNVQPDTLPEDTSTSISEYRLEALRERVGASKVPADITGKQLKGREAADVTRRIISNEIAETLAETNGTRDPSTKLRFEQLFDLRYADGSKMLTTGGLLFEEGQANTVQGLGFNDLDFVSKEGDLPYNIEVPSLTYRELRHLDSQLPVDHHSNLNAKGIPEKHLKRYASVYRYFPTVAEADF